MRSIKTPCALLIYVTAMLAGLIPVAAHAVCHGMVLHAHRGSPTAAENSLSAVRLAIQGEWDGAEIDIQQLRDQEWVLHHDAHLGRTTSLQGYSTRDLDSATWRELRMKDRQGRVTNELAPFLSDVIALPEYQDKILNVEIKQFSGTCDATIQAVSQLRRGRPLGGWFITSIDRRQLQCVRKIDPKGYAGQIVLDPQALARESRIRSRANRISPPVIDAAWLRRLQQEVMAPVGVHVDINTLAANPSLLTDAKILNVPVFTYHLGADKKHAETLRATARRTGLLPSGAIINGSASVFCDLIGPR
jgi:glycerophosphoryl diester phosphodiesterase